MHIIEEHYIANRFKLLKRINGRAGTPEDAEDVLQEAYCRAIKYFNSFKGGSFDNWFSTILNNALKEHKNTQKGFSTTSFEEDEFEGVPCSHYTSRIVIEIYQLISTKTKIQQEVLTYFFQQDYNAKDISRITDYSYKACHQIIQRFRNELKEIYG